MCGREAQSPGSALSSYISSTTACDRNAAFLFIWLHRVLVAAFRMFSCGMWDLVPWPGIEPGPPALRVCISAQHFSMNAAFQLSKLLTEGLYSFMFSAFINAHAISFIWNSSLLLFPYSSRTLDHSSRPRSSSKLSIPFCVFSWYPVCKSTTVSLYYNANTVNSLLAETDPHFCDL